MSEAADQSDLAADWTGLRQSEPTLPSYQYYDRAHFARELQQIWYRNWIYLCRSDALHEPLSFRTFEIGDQPILLLRDQAGQLNAFYNTCRHRGSVLCAEPGGRLRGKAITCPYHNWTYDLQGTLIGVPSYGRPKSIDTRDFSLYRVALQEWHGFVFVNLSTAVPAPFEGAFDPSVDTLARWPLGELVVGHTMQMTIKCNWKVFWENYNECLHCPNVHPALCSLVPIYRRAIMSERDDPYWPKHADSSDPQFKGGLRAGASSWSIDGQAYRHTFPDLTDRQRRKGYQFVTALPSFYVVAHVDYVRAVRLRSLDPEQTELQVEWLFPQETLSDPGFDMSNSVAFSARVMTEDGEACELAQRGLRSRPFANGVLLPEECEVHRFHNWVRGELARI